MLAAAIDRRQAEETLRLREEQIRSLIENSSDMVTILNADATIRYQCPAVERLLGYQPEDLMDQSAFEYIHPDDAPHVAHVLARMAQDPGVPQAVEFRLRHKDGSWRVFESIGKVLLDDSGGTYAVINSRDTTGRRRAEEALRHSDAQFRAMSDASPLGICLTDPEGDCLYFNRALEQVSGFTSQEVLGKGWSEAVHPEDRNRVSSAWYTAVQNRIPFESVHRFLRRDGTTIWGSVRGAPVRDEQRLFGYVVTLEDITERKGAEETLQQQLTRTTLLNQITRAIAERQDLQGIFHTVLRRLEDYLPVDFSGIRLFDPQADTLTVAVHGPKSRQLVAGLGAPEGTVVPVEQTGLRACLQGEMVYMADTAQVERPIPQRLAQVGIRSLVATPLEVENRVFGLLVAGRRGANGFSSAECEFLRMLGEHVALAAHHIRLDIDLRNTCEELRQTQHSILQQERLRALGQMTSGIVHDINNALSPIVGYTDLLLMTEPNLSDRAKRYLNVMKIAGTDLTHIVARMREFYRQREESEPLFPVNLNQLVRQVIDLTRPRWRDIPQERGLVVSVETDLDPDLPPVRGMESEIREAITNLIFNAVDAMPAGGEVTMRTPGAPTGAILESDTGIGMDEETRRRCLEPFFSTKGALGTGLGLSMVYGVMQRHEGEIEVESEPGKGTTMRLFFLLGEPAGAGVLVGLETTAPLPSLRVLCIDDEPLLRELVKDMVETGVHRVEVADGGQAGLDRFRAANERGEPFDVVITDLGMPYVDGREVARAVKRDSPATPVILLTGWGTRLNAEGDKPMEVEIMLGKPPKMREIREALAQVARK